MTTKLLNKKKIPVSNYFAPLLCLSITVVTVIFGEELKGAVYQGIAFSFSTIIPSLFPFFILSDLWSAWFILDGDSRAAKLFEKTFKINGVALPVFLSGLVCGFPLGVKGAGRLYIDNRITKEEFERLSGFVNNPSLAFVVFGVGAGILGNIYLGILLYLSVILSALITGFVFRNKLYKTCNIEYNSRQKFNFINSIKNSGIASINVASYIVFFSAVISVIEKLASNQLTVALLSCVLEVSNASKLVSDYHAFNHEEKLPVLAFALGFSGLSVHLQALSFFPEGISYKKYFLMKTLQGVLAFLIILLFLLIT